MNGMGARVGRESGEVTQGADSGLNGRESSGDKKRRRKEEGRKVIVNRLDCTSRNPLVHPRGGVK